MVVIAFTITSFHNGSPLCISRMGATRTPHPAYPYRKAEGHRVRIFRCVNMSMTLAKNEAKAFVAGTLRVDE